jgi:hypothetical protein
MSIDELVYTRNDILENADILRKYKDVIYGEYGNGHDLHSVASFAYWQYTRHFNISYDELCHYRDCKNFHDKQLLFKFGD